MRWRSRPGGGPGEGRTHQGSSRTGGPDRSCGCGRPDEGPGTDQGCRERRDHLPFPWWPANQPGSDPVRRADAALHEEEPEHQGEARRLHWRGLRQEGHRPACRWQHWRCDVDGPRRWIDLQLRCHEVDHRARRTGCQGEIRPRPVLLGCHWGDEARRQVVRASLQEPSRHGRDVLQQGPAGCEGCDGRADQGLDDGPVVGERQEGVCRGDVRVRPEP